MNNSSLSFIRGRQKCQPVGGGGQADPERLLSPRPRSPEENAASWNVAPAGHGRRHSQRRSSLAFLWAPAVSRGGGAGCDLLRGEEKNTMAMLLVVNLRLPPTRLLL